MEQNNRHPLEAITNSNSLSMLESLIPFVEYPLKLPLALLIKFNEIRLIINAFRSLDNLTRLGLHSISRDPMDMLFSLTGIPPEMLKMLFSMMENSNDPLSPDILSGLTGNTSPDMSNIASLFQSFSSNTEKNNINSSPHTDNHANTNMPAAYENEDFDRNIQNILAEYDLAQAEKLDREYPPDTFPPPGPPEDFAQNISESIY